MGEQMNHRLDTSSTNWNPAIDVPKHENFRWIRETAERLDKLAKARLDTRDSFRAILATLEMAKLWENLNSHERSVVGDELLYNLHRRSLTTTKPFH